jgi:hypothetical protein
MFSIFPRSTTFQAKGGVYVVGRDMGDDRYAICFVGHTGDLSARPLNRDKTSCFDRFGADQIFLIEEFDANRRAQVAEDLIQAYAPVCNTL